MSNVLIGIIGVILFIGLALAGALILGDDFKTASSSSKAAAMSSVLQQTAAAASMYEVKTGRPVTASTTNSNGEFLVPRFLKAKPVSPVGGGEILVVDQDGNAYSNAKGQFFFANIGTDAQAKDVCRAIEEGAGAANPDESQNAATVAAGGNWPGWSKSHKRVGCLLNPEWNPKMYQAYIPF
jgi:hypothetical protein